MNFITYKNAVSLYPNATLIHNRSYLLPMTPRVWQAAAALPLIQRDTWTDQQVKLNVHRRPLYTSDHKRELGIDVQRHMGDRWSCLFAFDAKGCVIDLLDSRGHCDNEGTLGNTKWVMKLNRTVPKLHPSNVDPSSFGPYLE